MRYGSPIRRGIMLVILGLSLAAPTVAQGARETKVGGAGTRKCSEWNDWKAQRNGEARGVAVEWARGFVAGHNVYSRADPAVSQVSPDAKVVASLLDAYCEKQLDDPLLFAAIDMIKRLGGATLNVTPRARPGRGDSKPEL